MPHIPISLSIVEANVDYKVRRFDFLGTALACLVYGWCCSPPSVADISNQLFPLSGVHLTMFCVTLQYTMRHSIFSLPRHDRYILVYTLLLFALATAGIGLQIRWSEIVIGDHSVGSAEFLVTQVSNHSNYAKTAMFVLTILVSSMTKLKSMIFFLS
jgi:hypothetical protein